MVIPIVQEIVDPRSGRPMVRPVVKPPSQRELVIASLLHVPPTLTEPRR
jgi:hypothetical protein